MRGGVGYFSTAGVGPVPKLCTSQSTLFDGLFEKTIAMTSACEVTQVVVDGKTGAEELFFNQHKECVRCQGEQGSM